MMILGLKRLFVISDVPSINENAVNSLHGRRLCRCEFSRKYDE